MAQQPKLIAMIPARLGSKRVPKKNIRMLCGKPLISHAIEAVKEAGCFDEIWVNSESDMLGALAVESGVRFHKRPLELATDTATNQDFTSEFLRARACDFVVMVNSTSPLLQAGTIRKFCDYVRENNYDTVLSVLEEYAECFFQNKPVNFSTHEKINSQDLEPVQKIIWALTAWRREHFLSQADAGACSVFSGKVGLFPVPLSESCDIDTQEQWDLAEGMLLAKESSSKTKEKIAYWRAAHED